MSDSGSRRISGVVTVYATVQEMPKVGMPNRRHQSVGDVSKSAGGNGRERIPIENRIDSSCCANVPSEQYLRFRTDKQWAFNVFRDWLNVSQVDLMYRHTRDAQKMSKVLSIGIIESSCHLIVPSGSLTAAWAE